MDPVGSLTTWARRHGDLFALRLPAVGRLVVVGDSSAAHDVIRSDPASSATGSATGRVLPLLGPSCVLRLDGDAHGERRRMLNPLVHGDGLARRREAIAKVTRRELAKWPADGPMPLLPRLSDLSFAVISEVVLGLTDEDQVDRLHHLVRRATGPAALAGTWLWPLGSGQLRDRTLQRVRQHQQAVDRAIVELLAKRADPGADRHDVADFLLDVAGHDSPTPDRELLEELRALLLVGHETTATALAWSIERLVRDPAVLTRLEESLAAGDQSYLEGVIREVLRWRPPVVDTVRELTAPMELAGHLLEAGTLVAVAPLLVHRHPELYSSPDAFVPERLIGDSVPNPATWIPFGGGTRPCLGAELALAEMEIVLSELLAAFTLEPTDARGERARLAGTVLVPARGATAVLSRRGAAIG
ncbi:MAG: cytochrome P450 [Acidimicrobiales bacterium]